MPAPRRLPDRRLSGVMAVADNNWSPMLRYMSFAFLLLVPPGAQTAIPSYPRELARWTEVLVPPNHPAGAYSEWSYAASYSKLEWRVHADGGKPTADIDGKEIKPARQPAFVPKASNFQGGCAYAVDDGWLVGFNVGEFGGALYWFSQTGDRHYKISNDQVVDFVSVGGDIYAIAGLAHLGYSRGSVIRIAPVRSGHRWLAWTFAELPFAPYAISVLRNGSMLITLSESLVSLKPDHTIRTLVSGVPWTGLYPNSSALSPDETKLYIGMRQFVGEVDLATNKLRLLIPAKSFLNRLPKQQASQIRKQYGD